MALNQNTPYVETVLPFPLLTNEIRLNDGSRLE